MRKYPGDGKCVVMSRDEVRAFDRWAIETVGIAGVVLMENAGRSCAELVAEKLREAGGAGVCIFCGTGNNGGDGYVIARHLLSDGFGVRVVICGDRGKVKGDAKINLDILEKLGQRVELLDPAAADIRARVESLAGGADMVVDALFGTGLRGQLSEPYRELIEGINGLAAGVTAVDIPSGLDCDTGEALGAAVRADRTVTFVAAKKGFAGAGDYTGEVFVASIGVEPHQKA